MQSENFTCEVTQQYNRFDADIECRVIQYIILKTLLICIIYSICESEGTERLCLQMKWNGGINKNGSYYDNHKPCDDDPSSVSFYTHPDFISLYRLRHAWEWGMSKKDAEDSEISELFQLQNSSITMHFVNLNCMVDNIKRNWNVDPLFYGGVRLNT